MGRFPHATPKLLTFGPFWNADPSGSKEYTIMYTEYGPIEILSAAIYNDAAVAANDSAYLQIALESGATATGGTQLFELDTRAAHEGAFVAGEREPMNETEGTVAISQYITLTVTEFSTAKITDATLEIWYQDGSPASE